MKIDYTSLIISFLVLVCLIWNILFSPNFTKFDHVLHKKLIHTQKSVYWKVIAFINEPRLIIIWDVLLAGLLLNDNQYKLALWVLFTLGLTDGAGFIIKHIVKRNRPKSHLSEEEGYSFPSGHVLGATTMCLIIYSLLKNEYQNYLIAFLVIYWISVVISRLNLRAHYPSDVLGAAALSVFCFTISQSIYAFLFL